MAQVEGGGGAADGLERGVVVAERQRLAALFVQLGTLDGPARLETSVIKMLQKYF